MIQKKTQTFNSGLAAIYAAKNISLTGDVPVYRLSPEPRFLLRYKERTVGIKRHLAAMQEGYELARVIRCPMHTSVTPQDVVKVSGGRLYRIHTVQYPEDVTPPVMDLSLKEVLDGEFEEGLTGGTV